MNLSNTQPFAPAMDRHGIVTEPALNEPFSPATVSRHHRCGADTVFIRSDGLTELHITIRPTPGDTIKGIVERLHEILDENNGVIARMEVFGALAARAPFLFTMQQVMGEPAWPMTWVAAEGFRGCGIAGICVLALAEGEVELLRVGNRTLGCVYNDAFARHCLLGEIIPARGLTKPGEQLRDVLAQIQASLEMMGTGVNAVTRTWFYLNRGNDWGKEFYPLVTEFFGPRRNRSGGIPATTQVIAQNAYGVAISAGAWAVVPTSPFTTVRAITSPLQGAPGDRGMNQARGMEWNTALHRRVTISSAGSFGFDGELLHAGEIAAQVELTMDAVEAMLVSRGLDFSDVTRAIAYVKLPRHSRAVESWFERHGIDFPAIITSAHFLHDDQLFELEVDATMQKPAAVRV
jgi:enamine deaminase RidA (YjgF/YER057c/UK114 family)